MLSLAFFQQLPLPLQIISATASECCHRQRVSIVWTPPLCGWCEHASHATWSAATSDGRGFCIWALPLLPVAIGVERYCRHRRCCRCCHPPAERPWLFGLRIRSLVALLTKSRCQEATSLYAAFAFMVIAIAVAVSCRCGLGRRGGGGKEGGRRGGDEEGWLWAGPVRPQSVKWCEDQGHDSQK